MSTEQIESELTGAESVLVPALLPHRSSRRVLEPAERIAEVLFGLIMVLTFTGSLSVAEGYGAPESGDVRAMLIGALGCNLAWGVIDGLFYLMGCLAEKGRNLATYKALLASTTPEEGRGFVVVGEVEGLGRGRILGQLYFNNLTTH